MPCARSSQSTPVSVILRGQPRIVSYSIEHGLPRDTIYYRFHATSCDTGYTGNSLCILGYMLGSTNTVENSLPHCGNMFELQDRTPKQIKRNIKSSIRPIGEQVVYIRRWGPRGHVEPTPLFFTPPRNIWWGLEIWCVHQLHEVDLVYRNSDRGNNNNNNKKDTTQ